MKSIRQQQQQRKRILIVIVIIIIAAMAFAYVIPLKGMASSSPPDTPAPEYGTDWGLDESTLPAPWEDLEEEEEDVPKPVLLITSTSLRLDVNQSIQIQYVVENFPEGTMLEWTSSNFEVAVVSGDGIVKAIAPGSAEIKVRAGEIQSSVLVSVNELRAGKIVIAVSEDVARAGAGLYELKVGDVIRLVATIEPAGAKVDKFSWVLGNDRVAAISPNGRNCDFVATAVGQTQVTVTADSLFDTITFNVIESGMPLDQVWEYIKLAIVLIIAAVVIIVALSYLAQRRKKERARQKAAAAKRRREEAERRAREEARMEKIQRERREPRPVQDEERMTMRISGAAVGAGIAEPGNGAKEQERPLTLDDLE